MENKQIVDDVDVSGCELLNKTRHCKAHISIMGTDTNKCKCFPNCYYKQLKREKQECEELKAEIKHYKQIAQYHGNLSVKYTNKSAKYKQTLTEIKEIAEKEVKRAPDGETFSRPEIKQILQKVSDVLKDE